jgi:hypothetical protein
MGKYDDITPDRLRKDLVAFAELLLRLDREDGLLRAAAEVQRLIGDLRQKLFAYEVRYSRLLPERTGPEGKGDTTEERDLAAEEDPVVKESLRVIREALRREEDMLREWEGIPPPEEDQDDE